MATTRSPARVQQHASAPVRGPERKLSRLHRPGDMSLEAWQRALRRQFGREQKFLLRRTGDHPVFSEFEVTNPQARTVYRVAIRGVEPGNNFCSCPDFVTNTLGTCKHIEFTLARLERAPGGRKALARRFDPPFSELYLHYGARREVRFRPRADAPVELTRLAARQFGADGALLPGAFAHFDGFLAQAARLDPDLRCYEDALGFVAQVRDAERRAKVLAEAFPRGARSATFTDLLRLPLYDYQREAALFAARAGRSVIGDDMGLGKTMEAIAAVEIMARHFGVERVLIVCPTSLKHQWEREILRVIDRPARVIGGFRRSREEAFRSESFYKITNYDTVYRDLDLITAWAPDHQILDEFGKVVGYRDLDRIGKTLAPILLRRRKEEVLPQLPERLEKQFLVPMTPQQMQHHEDNREIVGKIVTKWRRYRFLSEADQRRLMIALQNMRMACDSTYLLDQTTDHGTKADEVVTLLDEMFERPEAKAVVFSQWTRMHQVLIRRLERRKWRHVLFHGGVEGARRKDLVDRFREDPECRAFLSTDAGGVGLNLQRATAVVNVDLPWNPALLAQRIGRVHRLGQTRPVQVVNFVAKGTIEEGMLSVLGFKRSLFAGVLDGGEREVFLGGSRLKRFMESVQGVTAGISAPVVEEASEPAAAEVATDDGGDGDGSATLATAGTRPAVDPLGGLLRAGLELLTHVASGAGTGRTTGAPVSSVFERIRDDSGQSYLKIRMPEPEVMDRVAGALQALLESLRA